MSEKNRARQEAFTKRRQAEGLKRFQFWATPEEKDYLKKALDDFRDNRESTTPIHRETLIKGHDTFQDELLKGEFPPIKHKCPTYTIDKPWDNLRYWNNPLPKEALQKPHL